MAQVGPEGDVEGGITVNGELASLAAPHHKSVTAGTCLGFCLQKGH